MIQEGSASNQPICHVDFFATCADVLKSNLPTDAAVDSVSILPALLGEEDKTLREAVVHHSIDGRFAIRQGKWKLIFAPGSGGWASPKDAEATTLGMPDIQLYDMFNDPSESANIQSDHPDVVEKLTQLMEQYIEDGRSTLGPKQTNDVVVQRMTKKNAQPKP